MNRLYFILFITLILVFGITGFFNGFIKEIFSTAAWVLSLAIAWLYGPLLFPYVTDFIDSESIKNSFVNCFVYYRVSKCGGVASSVSKYGH